MCFLILPGLFCCQTSAHVCELRRAKQLADPLKLDAAVACWGANQRILAAQLAAAIQHQGNPVVSWDSWVRLKMG